MTITAKELKSIEDAYQYGSAGTVPDALFRIQRILGLLNVGDTLIIEDLNIELKNISEFKEYVKSRYTFGLLDMEDLLKKWKE